MMKKQLLLLLILNITTSSFSQNKVKYWDVLDGEIEVTLPKQLDLMTEEAKNIKYPYGTNKPQEVYTDDLGKINFTASLKDLPTEEHHLPEVKQVLVDNIKKTQITTDINDHFIKVNGKTFILLEFKSQGIDNKQIFNIMYASNLNGKLLIGSFNYPIDEHENWYEIAKKVINSIKVL